MSEPASISTGIAARYATAVFDICKDEGALDRLSGDLDALEGALSESAELREVVASPILTRDEQGGVMAALADKADLSATMKNTLSLMAQKRRLFVLPQLVQALRARLSAERGEVEAEVTSAKALTKAQSASLEKTLADRFGKTVKINSTVDESLIGGLVIKVGSQMIDTSIRSKLSALQNTMKEAR